MVAKTVVAVVLARLAHDGVDRANHRQRVAPGVVAAEQVAAQPLDDKGLRGAKHLRLGAAKAVNALLGITHQKHAGRRARAAIAAQPRRQRLPLQRIGVLELVNHQVANARIQPLLHPAGQHHIAQHDLRGALDVVHIDPAALALELGVLRQQHARQARHALLVAPSFMLLAGGLHAQHQFLRLPDQLDTDNFFAELARRALVSQQRAKNAGLVLRANGLLQLDALE